MAESFAPLTDLEGAVLGVVARDGPISSYMIARDFSRSRSEFWSGSAGAIYPLMARLVDRGWCSVRIERNGRRRISLYGLTQAGRAAFEHWLLDAERAAGMGFDPLRTRFLFLDLAPPARRSLFLKEVKARTRAAMAEEFHGPQWVTTVCRSWLKARLASLAQLSARIESSPEPAEAADER